MPTSVQSNMLTKTTNQITADLTNSYQQDGFVLLPALLDQSTTAAIRDEVMQIMAAIGLGQTKLRQTTRYPAGGTLDALVNSPGLREIAELFMSGPSTLYLPFTAVKSGGGGGRFHFHQDNQYTRFDGPGINLWFALTAMSVDNGCLQIVPGSHLEGTVPSDILDDGHRSVQHEPDRFVTIPMQPGDCVAFTRLTVHGSCPNTTPDPRVAYAVQYHRDDVNATWDGQDTPVNLKSHPRFSTGPVADLVPPTQPENLDGH